MSKKQILVWRGALAAALALAPLPAAKAGQWCANGVCADGVVTENGSGGLGDFNGSAFSDAPSMTVGTTYTPGRSIAANCASAGSVTLQLATTTLSWPVAVGGNILPFAASAINATTATCAFSILK